MSQSKGDAILAAVEEELREDYWQEIRALHEKIAPHIHYDSFRYFCNKARKNLGDPDPVDSVDPRYDPNFKPDPSLSPHKQALQWISNDLYRSRLQTTVQLCNRCSAAGYGDSTWIRKTWNSIVGNARKNTGRRVTPMEVSHINKKSGAYNTKKDPIVDIHAPPPDRHGGDLIAVRRLAMELIQDAIATAGKKEVKDMGRRDESAITARSFDVRYAKAWLQTPSATAIWCGVLNIDPDMVAAYSRRIHGVPQFSRQEIESYKNRVKAYKASVDEEIELHGDHHA